MLLTPRIWRQNGDTHMYMYLTSKGHKHQPEETVLKMQMTRLIKSI